MQTYSKAKHICDEACGGKLSLTEFWECWSTEASSDVFLNQVCEDIEDAIEHAPGKLLSGELMMEEWQQSREWLAMLVDSILLEFTKESPERLVAIHDSIVADITVSKATARERICRSIGGR